MAWNKFENFRQTPTPHDPQATRDPVFYIILTGLFNQCANDCVPINALISPNLALTGEVYADATLNTIARELAVYATNPTAFSWVDPQTSYDISNICDFNYKNTFITSNGATANINFGGKNYLIQSLWQNSIDCTMFAHAIILPYIPSIILNALHIGVDVVTEY